MVTAPRDWAFETPRLAVGPWHDVARTLHVSLVEIVTAILTTESTSALPHEWRGEFSPERARRWIAERDDESPTLLAVDRDDGRAIGFLIAFEIELDRSASELRIGYVIAEESAGRGFATELVGGLVNWAAGQADVRLLTAGVEATHEPSIRVLVKNGFEPIVDDSRADAELIYERRLGALPADPPSHR